MLNKKNTVNSFLRNSRNRYYILFLGMLILYFFYLKTGDRILNYPGWLRWTFFGVIFLTVIVLRFKKEKRSVRRGGNGKFLDQVVIETVAMLIFSFLATGIALIPFNYYNIYSAEDESSEVVRCKIEKVTVYSKNRCVYYTFKGRLNLTYGYRPIMGDIYKNENGEYEEYQFVATAKKGLLNSYILESWDIERKQ